jgi:hypothetical protein
MHGAEPKRAMRCGLAKAALRDRSDLISNIALALKQRNAAFLTPVVLKRSVIRSMLSEPGCSGRAAPALRMDAGVDHQPRRAAT